MEEAKLPDLTISGISKAYGGRYRLIEIEGVGSVDGDVSCDSFKANGMVTMKGNVRANRFELNGKMSGDGALSSGEVKVDGQLTLHGRLHGEEMTLNGYIKLYGDCEAERISLSGGFTVEGLLNAGTVDIVLHGRGQAREIGGERIQILKAAKPSWSRTLAWIIPAFEPHLFAGAIEGDDIRLEETTAKIVRGNCVHIGPGCVIDRIEYGAELVVHPDAQVAERLQV